MKINTTTPIKTLDGETLTENGKEITLGKMLSDTLGSTKSTDPIRAYEYAIKIRNEEEVEVDTQTMKLIKETVTTSNLLPFVSGQILKYLETVKE